MHYGGDLGYKANEMLEVLSEGLLEVGDLSLPNIAELNRSGTLAPCRSSTRATMNTGSGRTDT